MGVWGGKESPSKAPLLINILSSSDFLNSENLKSDLDL